ncbi:hypothetical protein L210DRAFT_3402178, partial [Boletus edulis BED1]
GSASGSTLSNYAAGIKAWHPLYGQPWNICQDELHLTLQGAACLALRSSKRAKRYMYMADGVHFDKGAPMWFGVHFPVGRVFAFKLESQIWVQNLAGNY